MVPNTDEPYDGIPDWWLFTGQGQVRELQWPKPPPWRCFAELGSDNPVEVRLPTEVARKQSLRGRTYRPDTRTIDAVNAALYLRRPLLVTGRPGVGKSSLIFAVAHELELSPVSVWPITSRTRLVDGLYNYDAIARLQTVQLSERASITDFLRLGPLGTAFLPSERPRALLIDEIDKGDIDLPNELLNLFEDGEFTIPELERLPASVAPVRVWSSEDVVPIEHGRVQCTQFPFVVMTSNGERDFPPAFLRRCLRLDIAEPDAEALRRIVVAHFGENPEVLHIAEDLIEDFIVGRLKRTLATDQLLNAIHLAVQGGIKEANRSMVAEQLWRSLDETAE